MPELPEMETYRAQLQQTVAGRCITGAEVLREKTVNMEAADFLRGVIGQQIGPIARRGKHILFPLASGQTLVVHLMLGGWMYYGGRNDEPGHRSQVILTLDNGRQLFFLGLRLGYLHLLNAEELADRLGKLGPNPLSPDFTREVLQQAIERKRGALKTTLVNQHCIAGIGNCYADEICFEAGIRPLTKIPALQAQSYARLHAAMPHVLERAIAYGGYMDHPFTNNDTVTGGYNEHCFVYDRGGEPCPRCHQPIIQTAHTGRKVFYCANCQS